MLNLVRNNIDIDEKEKIKLLDIKLLELFLPKQEKLLEECRNRKRFNFSSHGYNNNEVLMFYNNKNMKFQIIITITVLLMTTVSLYLAVMSIPLPV